MANGHPASIIGSLEKRDCEVDSCNFLRFDHDYPYRSKFYDAGFWFYT